MPTPTKTVVLIAAVTTNNVIGRDNDLPWHLPDDMKFFKQSTMGKPIIMGRRNWDAMNGRPLPGRQNIVLTRQPDFVAHGADVANELQQAVELAAGDTVMIIGGAQVYRLALPIADQILLTRIHAEIDGDIYFPDVDWSKWQRVDTRDHPADDRHAHSFTFETWIPQN